jgi:hypothetical protein
MARTWRREVDVCRTGFGLLLASLFVAAWIAMTGLCLGTMLLLRQADSCRHTGAEDLGHGFFLHHYNTTARSCEVVAATASYAETFRCRVAAGRCTSLESQIMDWQSAFLCLLVTGVASLVYFSAGWWSSKCVHASSGPGVAVAGSGVPSVSSVSATV